MSTDEIYGSTDTKLFTENSTWVPRNPYSAGKAAGQAAVLAWANTYNQLVTITNATNTYGSRQAPDRLVARLIIRSLLGKAIQLYGDGKQKREWIHVLDHCRAIWTVIQNGEPSNSYCVGGGKVVDNTTIANLILKNTGQSPEKIQYIEDRPGHDSSYTVNTEKLGRLGWNATVSFDEGIRQTIEWYKNNSSWWEYYLSKEII